MSAKSLVAAIFLLAAACSGKQSDCRAISREAAIALAVNSKPDNLREQDRSIWANHAVRGVEMTSIDDASAIAAKVHFEGNGRSTPTAFVYGDCVVEWTVRQANQ